MFWTTGVMKVTLGYACQISPAARRAFCMGIGTPFACKAGSLSLPCAKQKLKHCEL